MNKITAVSLMVGLVLFSTQTAFAGRPGKLLATTNNVSEDLRPPEDPVGTGTLLEVNSVTGTGSRIAQIEFPGVSLTFSNGDGLMYGALTVRGQGEPSIPKSRLVTINPVDGTTISIGHIRDATDSSIYYSVGAMSFAESGELYGITKFYGTTGLRTYLLHLDPKTALATPVGAGLGTNIHSYGGAILDGRFYFFTTTLSMEVMVWSVDLVSGVATSVGSTSVIPDRGGVGITVGGDGELFAALNNSLYEIDQETGLATLIGNTGFNIISGLGFLDTIASQCPCNQSVDGEEWKNHGKYVRCVAKAAKSLRSTEIDVWEYKSIMSDAAHSQCGKKVKHKRGVVHHREWGM